MHFSMRDHVVFAAAASKGLGYGIARACAQLGARVYLGSRTYNEVVGAAQRITEDTGATAAGAQLDASSAAAIQDWIAKGLERFGRIDGLVVNAGGPPPGKFDRFDDAAWEAGFNLTLMSAVRLIRAVLPSMRAQQSGSVLAVTSSSIKEPIPELLLSNVMRAGVHALLKSLATDLASEGIRFNNLVPGRIDTDRCRALDSVTAQRAGVELEVQRARMQALIPTGRYGTIEEFGAAGAFLLSPAAAYITGTSMVVDGGSMRSL